jgi:hypothetical protein
VPRRADQIVEDLKRQEQAVLAAVQQAGRASELMAQARWWGDAATERGAQAAAAEERRAAAAAADATREVQAAAHADAVQAASRAETAAAAAAPGGGGGGGGADQRRAQPQSQQQQQAGAAPSSAQQAPSTDAPAPGSNAWQWQAAGRWAARVSADLRAAVGQVGPRPCRSPVVPPLPARSSTPRVAPTAAATRFSTPALTCLILPVSASAKPTPSPPPPSLPVQVERLQRDHQHAAAVQRLQQVLETFTDVTRFPK